MFLNKEQTQHAVIRDEDRYICGLSVADLYARRQPSCAAYKNTAVAAAMDFTGPQMARLRDATQRIDECMMRIGKISATIDLRILARSVSWKFSLMRGKSYENGWPHTRLDTIYLSDSFTEMSFARLVEMLAHEKTHIFQRFWPEACVVYYTSQGYSRMYSRQGFQKRTDVNLRANPDLDRFVYAYMGEPCYTCYRTARPRDMEDVDQHGPHEHPNEAMAYMVGSLQLASCNASSEL